MLAGAFAPGSGLPSSLPPLSALAPPPSSAIASAGGGAASSAAAPATDRRSREIYLGNLAPNVAASGALAEFFNAVFAHLTPDPIGAPPVVRVKSDGQGRFAFVEFRTEAMAVDALRMDRVVEIGGRAICASRPKGYVQQGFVSESTAGSVEASLAAFEAERKARRKALEAAKSAAAEATRGAGDAAAAARPDPASPSLASSGSASPRSVLARTPAFAAPPPPEATRYVLLSDVASAGALRDPAWRRRALEEVRAECARLGADVEGAGAPDPPGEVRPDAAGRIYLSFPDAARAALVVRAFEGRLVGLRPPPGEDERGGHRAASTSPATLARVDARFVTLQEYGAAVEGGAWVDRRTPLCGLAVPAAYERTPLRAGVAGLAALDPRLSAMAQMSAQDRIADRVLADAAVTEVPLESGWVKARGLPLGVSKRRVLELFARAAPEGDEDRDVLFVAAPDGTALGEAYVHVRGPGARLRLALARDGATLGGAAGNVQVFVAGDDDVRRRRLAGYHVQ